MSTFRLLRKLGSTTIAESWAAVELGRAGAPTRRVVVLKRLLVPLADPAGLTRAIQCAREAGGDGVLPAAEAGMARGAAVLIEENVEGESLRTLLATLAAQKGRLQPNEGFAVFLQILGALAELHATTPPLVHGDVGPATAYLTPSGDVRLAEAGVAVTLERGAQGPARAEGHTLSPEQVTGPQGSAGDVFRAGLVLHELALGRPLFPAADLAQGFAQARGWSGLTAAALPSVPEPFATLLARMLAVDPAQRPTARDTQVVVEQAVRRLGWAVGPSVVAALYARTFATRAPLASLWNAPGEDVAVTPLPSAVEPSIASPTQAGPVSSAAPPAPGALPPPPGLTAAPRPLIPPEPSAPPTRVGAPPPRPLTPAAPGTLPPPPGPSSAPRPLIPPEPPAPAPRPVTPSAPGTSPLAPSIASVGMAGPGLPPRPPAAQRFTPTPGTTIPSPPSPDAFTSQTSQVGLGRIATRKVSLTELRELQAQDAPPPAIPEVPKSSPSGGIKDFRVGQYLVDQGKVSRQKLEEAVAYARDFSASLPDALAAVGAVEEDDLVAALGEVTRTPTIAGRRLDDMPPMSEALSLVSADDAVRLCLAPLSLKGSAQVVVALKDPMDEALIREVKALTGLSSVVAIRAGEQAIRRTISRFYGVADAGALPSWMEPSASAPRAFAPPPRPAPRVVDIPSAIPDAPPRRQTLAPVAPGRPITNAPGAGEARDGARLLLSSLLGYMGGQGKQARAVLELVAAVGRRLGLKDSEQSRLWLATAAVVVANLGGGRKPCDLAQAALAGALLGPAYLDIEPLMAPVTDARRPPISYLPSAALLATFTVANASGECPPSPVEALPALEALRPRLPALVLEAVQAELESL